MGGSVIVRSRMGQGPVTVAARMLDSPPPKPSGKVRRFLLHAVAWLGRLTLLGLALGVAGQFIRDRAVPFALMMYVPLVPLGTGAVLLDLAWRGRCLRTGRFVLGGMGLVAAVIGTTSMLGLKPPDPLPAGGRHAQVTLLHWNVMWGGDPVQWDRMAEQIMRRNPDLVVLSEAPSDDMIVDAFNRAGRGWRAVYITNERGSGYWYNPFVCSRGPLKLERRVPLRNGAGMLVLAEVRGRALRLLVVDGRSNPFLPRTPFLHDIAAACDEAARRGEPVDVIVGDFNAMGKSVGFDAVAASGGSGYRRAAEYSGGWRATWPVPLPLYDIDHAWARNGLSVLGCELFSGGRTDHRGQIVKLALPPER